MTNKCMDGGQWPADIQVFDYERMFGCFPERTDKEKGRVTYSPFHVYGIRANTG